MDCKDLAQREGDKITHTSELKIRLKLGRLWDRNRLKCSPLQGKRLISRRSCDPLLPFIMLSFVELMCFSIFNSVLERKGAVRAQHSLTALLTNGKRRHAEHSCGGYARMKQMKFKTFGFPKLPSSSCSPPHGSSL